MNNMQPSMVSAGVTLAMLIDAFYEALGQLRTSGGEPSHGGSMAVV